jgi:glutamyl/glutaminyl-tRNA synthetase
MLRLMHLLTPRIKTYSEIRKFEYLLTDPILSEERVKNLWLKFPQCEKVLKDMIDDVLVGEKSLHMVNTSSSEVQNVVSDYNKDLANKKISTYMYEMSKKKDGMKLESDKVFALLKFGLTGDSYGPLVGEIIEIIGEKATLKRLNNLLKDIENVKHYTPSPPEENLSNPKKYKKKKKQQFKEGDVIVKRGSKEMVVNENDYK